MARTQLSLELPFNQPTNAQYFRIDLDARVHEAVIFALGFAPLLAGNGQVYTRKKQTDCKGRAVRLVEEVRVVSARDAAPKVRGLYAQDRPAQKIGREVAAHDAPFLFIVRTRVQHLPFEQSQLTLAKCRDLLLELKATARAPRLVRGKLHVHDAAHGARHRFKKTVYRRCLY